MSILSFPRLLCLASGASTAAPVPVDHGEISILWSAPFVLLLACIALMPFVARHWWEKHYRSVAFGLAALVAGYYILYRHAPGPWLKEMREYASFMVLLTALFVVSGGIAIRINRRATIFCTAVKAREYDRACFRLWHKHFSGVYGCQYFFYRIIFLFG